MRFRFLTGLVIVLAVAGTYWYSSTAAICPAPLHYRLGTHDAEFNISVEAAKEYMTQAELVWEQEVDQELFIYDEDASFVVDFVFDERQEFADEEASETNILDAKRIKNEQTLTQVEALQSEYINLKNTYEANVASYEERLRDYNQTVSNYNDRGGAPAEEFGSLQKEQKALDNEVDELSRTAEELNNLANQINELGARGNDIVEAYNREVSVYNQKYGFSREFTQGDYQGDRINIYKFSTEKELVAVLTHEFGHALGLGHVEGESSVMYYLLVDADHTLQLSVEDKQVLLEACGDGAGFGATVRREIRSLLALFN